jgi:hypothetical protein
MSDLDHRKLLALRAAVGAQEWQTVRRLADELLSAHGHESGDEAQRAQQANGYSGGHRWPVWREAFEARNLPEVVKARAAA